ncbi:MAG TPA: hypothetical protein PLX59_01205 [Candidatus Cloacimonadota bacterium]|nr:hypothetical protein [Candidatus Cloacimonadota bacterium]
MFEFRLLLQSRRLLELLLLSLLLFLGACATIDSSMLETAETLPQGKIRITGYTTSALMIHSMFSDYLNDPDNPDPQESDGTASTPGLKLNYGLLDHAELSFSSNLSSPMNNGRLSLKYALNQPVEKFRFAIMPSIYYNSGEDGMETNPGGTSEYRMLYKVLGGELPLLITYRREDVFAITLCPKIAYNRFLYRRAGGNSNWETYESYLAGLVASPSFKFGIVTITAPELGIFYYPVKEGDYHIQPTLTFGVGLEFR